MGNLQWFAMYPDDWTTDPVAMCSLAAQGLWLRMMFVMHRYSQRYGFLEYAGKPMPEETVSLLCGVPLDEYLKLLSELKEAGVPSFTSNNTLFSRRMVRDARKRAQTALRVERYRNARSNASGNASGNTASNALEENRRESSHNFVFSQDTSLREVPSKTKKGWVNFDEERRKRTREALDSVFTKTKRSARKNGGAVHKKQSKPVAD